MLQHKEVMCDYTLLLLKEHTYMGGSKLWYLPFFHYSQSCVRPDWPNVCTMGGSDVALFASIFAQ